jgi:hypothetical protein
MLEHSAEIDKICAALAKAQGAMEGAVKDRQNPHFKNEYATLASVIEAVRIPLRDNELAFIQASGEMVDGALPIETRIVHSSGQWFRSILPMPVGQKTAQAVGSALSYGRRYALMAMLGVPSVDDDGEAASQGAPQNSNGSQNRFASPPKPASRTDHAAPDLSSSQRFADKIMAALAGKSDEAAIRQMEGSGAFKDCYDNLDEPERIKVDAAIQAKRESFRARAA